MIVKRKSDGKQIEVREWRGASDVVYSTLDMNEFYQESDLDFLPEKETAVLEGWVARDEAGGAALYHSIPKRDYIFSGVWIGQRINLILPTDSFPSVTWRSEPKKVRMTLELID